jgi:hypothetical protein
MSAFSIFGGALEVQQKKKMKINSTGSTSNARKKILNGLIFEKF